MGYKVLYDFNPRNNILLHDFIKSNHQIRQRVYHEDLQNLTPQRMLLVCLPFHQPLVTSILFDLPSIKHS